MGRYVYINRSQGSSWGCGCLAVLLLLSFWFLKSFGRILLVVILVYLIYRYIVSYMSRSTTNKGDVTRDEGEVVQSAHRPIKEAEVIDEQQD